MSEGAGRLVLVTGATGFVGRALSRDLLARGWLVRASLRDPASAARLPAGVEGVTVGDLAHARPGWAPALAGVHALVHSAGIAHAGPGLPDALYDRVNREATLDLARAATEAAVRRFVFISSIRAMTGPASLHPLTEDDPPAPTDAYGRSKLAAEHGLVGVAPPFVALRPVLVHGPGVAGNLGALARLARLPVPLPLASLTGRRSLVGVDNLSAAVALALDHPGAVGRALIAADPEPLTVGEIVAALRAGLERPPGLLPCPPALLRSALALIGRPAAFERLAGDLVARPDGLLALGWRPVLTAGEGLARVTATPL